MKKIFGFIFVFSVVTHLTAQQIQWMPQGQLDDKFSHYKILGEDETGYYLLESNIPLSSPKTNIGLTKRRYRLSYLSEKMMVQWSKMIVPSDNSSKITGVYYFNSRILIFSKKENSLNKSVLFTMQWLNNKGDYTGTQSVADEVIEKKFDSDFSPQVIASHDENKIGLLFKNNSDKTLQLYSVACLDTSLKIIYKTQISIADEKKIFSLESFKISDRGETYILGRRSEDEKGKKAKAKLFYHLYTFDPQTSQTTKHEINEPNKLLTDAGMQVDNQNNRLVVSGFYSERNSYSTAGVFYYSFKTDSAIETPVHLCAFDSVFLSNFSMQRKDLKSKELVDCYLSRIILRNDGGAVLVAEQQSEEEIRYFNNFTMMYTVQKYFYFNNIIVLSVNPDGKILWSEVIHKDQASQNDNGEHSSFQLSVVRDKLFFTYNKFISDETSVLLATVNSRGEKETKILFTEPDRVYAFPRSGKQVSEGEVLLPSLRDGNFSVAKIEF